MFVDNEPFETLRDCHEQVFDTFGGMPMEVLYDNMRTVVQERDALPPWPPTRLVGLPRPDPVNRPLTSPFPAEPLQHPLSVYDDLPEAV